MLYWDELIQIVGSEKKTWMDVLNQKRTDRYVVFPWSLLVDPPKLPANGKPPVPVAPAVGGFSDVKEILTGSLSGVYSFQNTLLEPSNPF